MVKRELVRGIPGLRRWKREYLLCIRILGVMSLCFFFLIGVTVIGDSLEFTENEERKEAFGEWEYAISDLSESDEERIRSIPFLQKSGAIWTYGTIVNPEIKGGYALGGADSEGRELGRLKLVAGRWPEQVGEAAVEASLLQQLGYPSETGVSIDLSIVPYEEAVFGSHGEALRRTQDAGTVHLDVCGVIKDYVYGWNISDSYDLPSVFITDETAEREGLSLQIGHSGNRLSYILLLKGRADWDTMEEDLQGMALARDVSTAYDAKKQGFRRNDNTMPNDSQSVLHLMILSLMQIGGFLGTIILFICVWYSVKNRRPEWKQLYMLGMEVRAIRGLLLQEALVFGLTAAAAGVSGGVLLFLVGNYWHEKGVLTLQMHWDTLHFLTAVLLGGGSIVIAYGIPIVLSRRIILDERKGKRSYRGKKRKRRMPGLWTICVREWISHPIFSIAMIVLLSGCIVIPCFGIREIYNRKEKLLRAEQRGETGYVIKPADVNMSDAGVSKESARQLKNVYGVRNVILYHGGNEVSYPLQLNLQGIHRDPYIVQILAREKQTWQLNLAALESDAEDSENTGMMTDYRGLLASLEEGYFPIHIWTTSDEIAWKSFMEDVAVGTPDLQKILKGEEVILIMPDLVKEGDDSYYDWIPNNIRNPYETERISYSGGIYPGDQIKIKNGIHDISVTVGGVITASEHYKQNGLMEAEPFTILSGDPFFESLSLNSSMPADYYQYIAVNAENTADIVTDHLVQKMIRSENAELYNFREEYQRNQTDYLMSIGYYGGACGLGTIVCLVLIQGLLRLQAVYREEKKRLLCSMGIPRNWLLVIRGVDIVFPSLVAVFAAFAGISCLLTYMDRMRLSSEGVDVPFMWRVGFPLRWFAICCALFVILFLWIGIHEEKDILREKTGELI